MDNIPGSFKEWENVYDSPQFTKEETLLKLINCNNTSRRIYQKNYWGIQSDYIRRNQKKIMGRCQ